MRAEKRICFIRSPNVVRAEKRICFSGPQLLWEQGRGSCLLPGPQLFWEQRRESGFIRSPIVVRAENRIYFFQVPNCCESRGENLVFCQVPNCCMSLFVVLWTHFPAHSQCSAWWKREGVGREGRKGWVGLLYKGNEEGWDVREGCGLKKWGKKWAKKHNTRAFLSLLTEQIVLFYY